MFQEYVVAHETGHALGFWHTHQRPDRERYISINWKNVLDEATASFMPFRSMLQAFGIRQVYYHSVYMFYVAACLACFVVNGFYKLC